MQHGAPVGERLAVKPGRRRGGSKGVFESDGGVALEHARHLVTVQPNLQARQEEWRRW